MYIYIYNYCSKPQDCLFFAVHPLLPFAQSPCWLESQTAKCMKITDQCPTYRVRTRSKYRRMFTSGWLVTS